MIPNLFLKKRVYISNIYSKITFSSGSSAGQGSLGQGQTELTSILGQGSSGSSSTATDSNNKNSEAEPKKSNALLKVMVEKVNICMGGGGHDGLIFMIKKRKKKAGKLD